MQKNSKQFWLAEAEGYVLECVARRSCVRASEFAVRMRRSPPQLAREFHAVVGVRLKDFFSTLCVERATELLRTTGASTAEVAIGSGFGTVRSFYRVFRRATGVSPTEYRKELSLAPPPFRP